MDFVNGLDANNGLGPDASHGTNKPWKTITKLLGAAGMASGDTAYLSPAGPFREVVSVAMTSAVAETKVIGDPTNAQGFKTSGGVLVAPGQIIVTAYLTNDKTAPSATSLLTLAGRDFLTFEKILFVGGSNATLVLATTQSSINITFNDCAFIGGKGTDLSGQAINITSAFAVALNWLIDRCIFVGALATNQGMIQLQPVTAAGADWDLNFVVRNSVFLNGTTGGSSTGCIRLSPSGGLANKPGGIIARNCTFWTGGALCTSTATSTTIPCQVLNSFIVCGAAAAAVNAQASGQITENYNLFVGPTPRTNVTAGANSISDGSHAPLFHFGQERIFGQLVRAFMEPMAGSPLLGFANDGSQTATDGRNNPRPAGGSGDPDPAAGAFERGNTWRRETSTVRTGSNALSVTGPGYQDFLVPVDAASTTISVYLRHDATYAGTDPKLQVLANAAIGVTAAEDVSGATDDTWEQQSLNFTPTGKGIVTIRLLSLDTNGGGKAFADDFAVA